MNLKRCLLSALLLTGLLSLQLFGLDDSKVEEHALDNGLRVITYEMHTAPIIYSRLTYNIGSKYEPYNQTGISHIVEHMMFKGTKRFPKGAIAELISANGGIFNAFTANDITVYYELLPKNKIDLAFDIESQRMSKCAFDPKEFESEIKVIMEERKQRTENQAAGKRREELNTLLYKNHPYRNPVIGWMEDIKNITRDQAYAHYRKYYTPNNATLVLTGDFDTAEIMRKVEKYFGKIPSGPALAEPRFFDVPQEGKKALEFRHPDILNESISMYFAAPTRFQEDGAALYVLGNILCSRSATSRLNKRLVRKEKLCKSTGGGLGFSKDPRPFSISANLLPDADIAEVEAIIWEEIDSLKHYPVSDYDLQKIKNRLAFRDLTDDRYISEIGDRIGTYDNYVGWQKINRWDDMVAAVSKDDIMRVANKYFDEDNLVVCYSKPDSTVAVKDSEISAAGDDDTEPDDHPDGNVTESEITVDDEHSSKPGFLSKLFGNQDDVHDVYKPRLDEIPAPNPIATMVDSFILDNGVPVYMIESHDFPTVAIMGFIETGRLVENEAHPGIRQYVSAMLTRGTTRRSYEDLLEERSFTPYQFDFGQSWNNIVFTGYSLVKDADKMLKGSYEMLSEPDFPEEEMEKVKPRLISSARNFRKTETMKAFYTMFEQVFKGHQYALPYAGLEETYENVTRKDLLNFYNKYFSPDRLKMVVVGDFDKTWIKEKLNQTYGQWQHPSGDEDVPFSRIKPIRGKYVYVFNNPEYKQCRIDMAFNTIEGGIRTDNRDYETLKLLEYILCGSSLTSRMGVELRDRQGLSYGIKSTLWIRDHGGYWNIRTELDKDNVQKMVAGIFAEIKKVQENGVTDDELNKAKARKISQLTLQTRTADDIGGVIFNQLRNNRPLDHFDKRRDAIMAVSKEDVQRMANKYLDVNNYIISVSGDLSENALDMFK
ncbi:MAG: hypothetical protein DRP96_04825 [Candidatus Neomarinimicrobiota bacterium]|nr:MAG: hypothetical protein DRP96_04825 [Candidatus Neomarinimicrobiota bacterium]